MEPVELNNLQIGADGVPVFTDATAPEGLAVAPAAPLPAESAAPDTPQLEEDTSALGYGVDVLKGVGSGVLNAVEETAQFVGETLHESPLGLNVKLGGSLVNALVPEEANKLDFSLNPDSLDWNLANKVGLEPTTAAGNIAEGITQFVTAFVGAGKTLKPIKAGKTWIKTLGHGAGAGAVADGVAFDPDTKGLFGTLVAELPQLQTPISDFLTADEDTPAVAKRLENSIEGLFVGGAVNLAAKPIIKLVKGIKASGLHKAQAATTEQIENFQQVVDPNDLLRQDDIPETVAIKLGRETAERMEASKATTTAQAIKDEGLEAFDASKHLTLDEGDNIHFMKLVDEDIAASLKKNEGPVGFQEITKASTEYLEKSGFFAPGEAVNILQKVSSNVKQAGIIVQAMRKTLDVYGQEAGRLAARITQGTGTDIDAIELFRLKQVFEQLGKADKDYGTELARGLVHRKINVVPHEVPTLPNKAAGDSPRPSDSLTNIQIPNRKEIAKMTPSDRKGLREKLGITEETALGFARRIMAYGPDRALMVKELAKLPKKGLFDIGYEYWVNNLLSGVITQTVNMGNNAVKLITLPIEKGLGAAIKGDTQMMKEAAATFRYYGTFLRESLHFAGRALKEERNILDPQHMVWDNPNHATDDMFAISKENYKKWVPHAPKNKHLQQADRFLAESIDWIGKAVRLPSRFLLSGDELFKQLHYRANLASKIETAAREVPELTKNPKALHNYIKNEVEKAFSPDGQALNAGAARIAQEGTWTQPLTQKGFMNSLFLMRNKHPIMRVILPFYRTPANLIDDTMRHTPGLSLASAQWREALKAGGERAAIARGQLMLGTMFWGAAGLAALEGRITGSPPRNPAEREALLRTGWQPYSIKVGDTYYSYKRLEPWSTVAGTAADVITSFQSQTGPHQSELEAASVNMVFAVAHNLSERSFLMGISDMTEAIFSDNSKKLSRYLQNVSYGLVPYSSFMRQSQTLIPDGMPGSDTTIREARTFFDGLWDNLPGLSNTLPEKRDWLTGQPLLRTNWTKEDTKDPVAKALYEMQDYVQRPGLEQIEGIPLTGEQRSRKAELIGTLKLGGTTLHKQLETLISSPRYKQEIATDEGKEKMGNIITRYINKYKNYANHQLKQEFPDIVEQIEAYKGK